MKVVTIVLALLLVLAFLLWKFGPSLQSPLSSQRVTLNYWGFEDERVVGALAARYQTLHPNVTINYVKQSLINYRSRAQAQIRGGSGPDVLLIHSSWVPMFSSDLSPAPSSAFVLGDYQKEFYPVAVKALVKENKIYAAPAEIDGLALYINEEILNGVGMQPPRNWKEFVDSAVKMTVMEQDGTIRTAGAAMGATSNVDYWPDILGLLLLQQPGVDLPSLNLTTPNSSEVLRFYTGFVSDPKRKTWDLGMPPSISAFVQGRLGYFFGPSAKAFEIRQLNPSLKFKVVPVPQLSGKNTGWASFWAFGVSSQSKFSSEAWDFIKFLTSKEGQQLTFAQQTQVGVLNKPYSRVDLAGELVNDPFLGPFIAQGPAYQFWYLSSNTFDSGLNDEMIKVWEEGVNATLSGRDPQTALQNIQAGAREVINKFLK